MRIFTQPEMPEIDYCLKMKEEKKIEKLHIILWDRQHEAMLRSSYSNLNSIVLTHNKKTLISSSLIIFACDFISLSLENAYNSTMMSLIVITFCVSKLHEI